MLESNDKERIREALKELSGSDTHEGRVHLISNFRIIRGFLDIIGIAFVAMLIYGFTLPYSVTVAVGIVTLAFLTSLTLLIKITVTDVICVLIEMNQEGTS